jgi:hypothetical protein
MDLLLQELHIDRYILANLSSWKEQSLFPINYVWWMMDASYNLFMWPLDFPDHIELYDPSNWVVSFDFSLSSPAVQFNFF